MYMQFYLFEPLDMNMKMKNETRLRTRLNVRYLDELAELDGLVGLNDRYSDVYPDETSAIQMHIRTKCPLFRSSRTSFTVQSGSF